MIDLLIDAAIVGGVPAYLLLEAWTLVRWRGGWQTAAMVPLVPATPIVVWCGVALAADSNLWPLPFIFFAPLGALYLVVLIVARRLTLAAPSARR